MIDQQSPGKYEQHCTSAPRHGALNCGATKPTSGAVGGELGRMEFVDLSSGADWDAGITQLVERVRRRAASAIISPAPGKGSRWTGKAIRLR